MDVNNYKAAEGSCIISEEVVASIAGIAAMETPGVTALVGRPGDMRGMMSTNASARSVRVLNNENETVLDLYLTLKQGVKIQEVALAVQQNVKNAVQSMTGKAVTRVNVHVLGMKMEEKKED
ncbi:MAG: Asp23/Gls24 family envelope stress response protein [Ruminococcaceae bacterium]|nr:Asp23/Gls24 family envelope stress response protein [Oscillospiraceae bacterium]